MWEVLLYMCCFYWLMNKEASWAYDRAEQYKVGTPSIDREKKEVELGRCPVAAEGDRCHGTLLVNYEPHGKI